MDITVNGEAHTHQGNGTLISLLDEIGAQKEHTALMLNGNVIPAIDWSTQSLTENDQIEILVFVGGG